MNELKCTCSEFDDLELKRKAISRRAKESRRQRGQFTTIAEHADKEHRLLRCPSCGQLWQSASAWNWGAKEYLFKVPEIGTEEWLGEPYVDPDEVLIFVAVLSAYLDKTSFRVTTSPCKTAGCNNRAVELSALCLLHHIENLQEVRVLPVSPKGRTFGRYVAVASLPAHVPTLQQKLEAAPN